MKLEINEIRNKYSCRGYRICVFLAIVLLGFTCSLFFISVLRHHVKQREAIIIKRKTPVSVTANAIYLDGVQLSTHSKLIVSSKISNAAVERRLCSAKYVDFAQSLMPVTRTDVLGFICAATAVIMSAVGGIGAGGILIPVFILVMGFRPKHAIPLSAVTVLGGSIANNLTNKRKRHPLVDRPIVDWDLILAVEPLSLIGALLGTFINKIFPEEILGVVLVLFLVVVAHLTLKRAYACYGRENSRCLNDDVMLEVSSPSVVVNDDIELTRTCIHNPDSSYHLTGNDDKAGLLPPGDVSLPTAPSDVTFEFKQEREKLEFEERRTLRPSSLILATTVLVVLFVNIMKGGEAFKSPLGFDCGSLEFWSANLLMIVWLFTTYFHARVYLMSQIAKKDRVNYKYVTGDIRWDQKSIVVFPIMNWFAGLFGGMFGVVSCFGISLR